MKNYIKNGAKILYNYVLTLIVFAIFIYVFISATGSSFGTYLPLYSFLLFLLAFFIIYSDTKRVGIKEKRPQYDLKPYPLKGFVYGLVGFIPVALLEIVSVFLVFDAEYANNIKRVALNALMGPLFFIIKAFGKQPLGYVLATLAVPVVSMLGYLAGYYNFNIIKRIKKEDKKFAPKGFEKSPWNPSNKTGTAAGRKKRAQK